MAKAFMKVFNWGLQFQRVQVHIHQDREHGLRKAGMLLEQQLRDLYINLQAEGTER